MSNGMIRDTDRQPAPELERLVAQYQGAVLRTCYLYLCDRSQAEDAVQETFLKVYRNLDSFRGESSEKTWILKIAMRTCYDMNHSGWSRFFQPPGHTGDASRSFRTVYGTRRRADAGRHAAAGEAAPGHHPVLLPGPERQRDRRNARYYPAVRIQQDETGPGKTESRTGREGDR